MTKVKSLKFEKTYDLTEEETQNFRGREKMGEFVLDLIQRDIAMYLATVVYKRLNLAPDTKSEISEDRTKLIVDNSPKLIIPKGGVSETAR